MRVNLDRRNSGVAHSHSMTALSPISDRRDSFARSESKASATISPAAGENLARALKGRAQMTRSREREIATEDEAAENRSDSDAPDAEDFEPAARQE